MTNNPIQLAITARLKAKKKLINLAFADFTCYDSLLNRQRIQNAFTNILKYPYYYPTAKGDREARQAICAYYQQYGQTIDPERILLTSSLNESYLYLLKIFGTVTTKNTRTSAQSQILVARPSTPGIDEIASLLNQTPHYFELNSAKHWQIDFDSLKKAITPHTRAIFLSSPHLPSGAIQTADTLAALFEMIKGKNIAVIIDESLSDFIFDQQEFPISESLLQSDQVLITMQTLSNSFALPGLKLSWLIIHGPHKLTAQLYQSLEYLADTFLNVNQLSQSLLPDLLKYPREWRYKFAQQVEKNRNLTIRLLSKSPQLKFHHPEGGFYCLVEVASQHKNSSQLVVDILEKTGIYFHPGSYYGLHSNCYLVICFLQKPTILNSSLKKLLKYLQQN